MKTNPIIERLPSFLSDFIVDQNYQKYTARDHAIWRYVMRKNNSFLKAAAHPTYIEGLTKTGISTEYIPSIDEMNKILSRLGWAAACVDGFIPPSAFMAFQANKVLVIAADIRSINQIAYTPAPDIIHEAAGHAPIIADPAYAAYLIEFGKLGFKAFPSKKDKTLYEAIRHLSILKASKNISEKEILKAEQHISHLETNMGTTSELAQIRNLHWWTVEYGLVGDIDKPKIYGAGLLSSIQESKEALTQEVKKIPYSLEALHYAFDITQPQKQLFVTPNFEHLSNVLNEFSSQMACKKGGLEGVQKAIDSEDLATVEYNSGLQVSGQFIKVIPNRNYIAYIQAKGPVALNYKYKMLPDHSTKVHHSGFGSPVGKIKGCTKPTHLLSDQELSANGIKIRAKSNFEFESGTKVSGVPTKVTRKEGKIILIQFSDCTVLYKDNVLFHPSWGVYDMAVGEYISSAFHGPADPEGYGLRFDPPKEKTHQMHYSREDMHLFEMYQRVHKLNHNDPVRIYNSLWDKILSSFPQEWLLIYELLQSTSENKSTEKLNTEIEQHFNQLLEKNQTLKQMISF